MIMENIPLLIESLTKVILVFLIGRYLVQAWRTFFDRNRK